MGLIKLNNLKTTQQLLCCQIFDRSDKIFTPIVFNPSENLKFGLFGTESWKIIRKK